MQCSAVQLPSSFRVRHAVPTPIRLSVIHPIPVAFSIPKAKPASPATSTSDCLAKMSTALSPAPMSSTMTQPPSRAPAPTRASSTLSSSRAPAHAAAASNIAASSTAATATAASASSPTVDLAFLRSHIHRSQPHPTLSHPAQALTRFSSTVNVSHSPPLPSAANATASNSSGGCVSPSTGVRLLAFWKVPSMAHEWRRWEERLRGHESAIMENSNMRSRQQASDGRGNATAPPLPPLPFPTLTTGNKWTVTIERLVFGQTSSSSSSGGGGGGSGSSSATSTSATPDPEMYRVHFSSAPGLSHLVCVDEVLSEEDPGVASLPVVWTGLPKRFVRNRTMEEFYRTIITLAISQASSGGSGGTKASNAQSLLGEFPRLHNRAVDLYTLFQVVMRLGGSPAVTAAINEDNWRAVLVRLGLTPTPANVTHIRRIYRRCLLPYEAMHCGHCGKLVQSPTATAAPATAAAEQALTSSPAVSIGQWSYHESCMSCAFDHCTNKLFKESCRQHPITKRLYCHIHMGIMGVVSDVPTSPEDDAAPLSTTAGSPSTPVSNGSVFVGGSHSTSLTRLLELLGIQSGRPLAVRNSIVFSGEEYQIGEEFVVRIGTNKVGSKYQNAIFMELEHVACSVPRFDSLGALYELACSLGVAPKDLLVNQDIWRRFERFGLSNASYTLAHAALQYVAFVTEVREQAIAEQVSKEARNRQVAGMNRPIAST